MHCMHPVTLQVSRLQSTLVRVTSAVGEHTFDFAVSVPIALCHSANTGNAVGSVCYFGDGYDHRFDRNCGT
jgi:hypothetical protein